MKPNYLKLITLLMFTAVLIGACDKKEDTEPADDNSGLIHEYLLLR